MSRQISKLLVASTLPLVVTGCGRLLHVRADGSKTNVGRQLEALDQLIDEYAQKGLLSGSIFIAFQNGTTYERAVNLASDEERIPNAPDTLTLISSVSKGYTAAAVLRLEELGKLSVDDPVAKFFPEYPAANLTGRDGTVVKVHHLLNHTSGIPEAYDDPNIDGKLYNEPIAFAEVLAAIRTKPLESNPGANFSYSNTGYIMLGEIVRRAAQQSYGEFAKANLFVPAGLAHTYIGFPEDQPHSTPYEKEHSGRANYLTKYRIKQMHVTDVFTDGNIVATARDVATWAQQIGSGKVLAQTSLDKMFEDYGERYGYGWDVDVDQDGHKLISHAGGWVGYASYVIHSLDSGATLAYLLNQEMKERDEGKFLARLKAIIFPEQGLSDE